MVLPAPMGILCAPGSMPWAWLSDNRALFSGSVRRYPMGWLAVELRTAATLRGERMPAPGAKRYRGGFKSLSNPRGFVRVSRQRHGCDSSKPLSLLDL